MKKCLLALALALSSMFLPALAPATEAVTEEEARSIGVDSYLYFYSPAQPLRRVELDAVQI